MVDGKMGDDARCASMCEVDARAHPVYRLGGWRRMVNVDDWMHGW